MASVPELTKRIFSMAGKQATMRSARSASAGRRGAETGRVARGALNGFDHRRKGVAQDHRPPGAEIVDIAVAVGVGEPGALSAFDKRRRAAHRAEGPHGRVDAAGEEALGALLEGLGTGVRMGGRLGTHRGFSIEGGASLISRIESCGCALASR